MIIYTSAYVEKVLQDLFMSEIKIKEKEIKEREVNTGKIQKYTAYAYIHKPLRIFHMKNNQLYVELPDGLVSIDNKPDPKGAIYRTDPDFDSQLEQLIKSNSEYKITFMPSGRYGPTIYYCNNDPNVYPALIEFDNFSLTLENEDAYDIGVL